MSPPALSRRAALVGTASLATLAGCGSIPVLGGSGDRTRDVASARWLPPLGERPGTAVTRLYESRPAALADAGSSGGPVVVDSEYLDRRVRFEFPGRNPVALDTVRRRDLDTYLWGESTVTVRVGGDVAAEAESALADALTHTGSVEKFDLYAADYAVVGIGPDAVISSTETYGRDFNRRLVRANVSAHADGPRFVDDPGADATFDALGDPLAANVPTRLQDPATFEGDDVDRQQAAFEGFVALAGSLANEGGTAVSRGVLTYGSDHPVPETDLREWLGLTGNTELSGDLGEYDDVRLDTGGRTATLVARQPLSAAVATDVQPLPI